MSRRSSASLGQPLRLVGGGAKRAFQLFPRARPAQRKVELGAKQRERSSELVTCIRHESTLVLDRLLQAPEHLVQRLRKPRDLVAGRRHRQPARLPRMHRLRPATHELDRLECPRGERVSAERSGEQRKGQEDQELVAEVVERLLARFERAREHSNAAAGSRQCEDAPLTALVRNRLVQPHSPAGHRLRDDRATDERRQIPWLRVAQPSERVEALRERPPAVGVHVDAPAATLLSRLREQRRVDRAEQLVADAVVHEETDRREHDGHRCGKAQGEADADRDAAHGVAHIR